MTRFFPALLFSEGSRQAGIQIREVECAAFDLKLISYHHGIGIQRARGLQLQLISLHKIGKVHGSGAGHYQIAAVLIRKCNGASVAGFPGALESHGTTIFKQEDDADDHNGQNQEILQGRIASGGSGFRFTLVLRGSCRLLSLGGAGIGRSLRLTGRMNSGRSLGLTGRPEGGRGLGLAGRSGSGGGLGMAGGSGAVAAVRRGFFLRPGHIAGIAQAAFGTYLGMDRNIFSASLAIHQGTSSLLICFYYNNSGTIFNRKLTIISLSLQGFPPPQKNHIYAPC